MRTRVATLLLLACASLFAVMAATAGSADRERRPVVAATELSSQGVRTTRARTRIRVTPARRLVRQCNFRLVREVSARGIYIVPRQRCWWARH